MDIKKTYNFKCLRFLILLILLASFTGCSPTCEVYFNSNLKTNISVPIPTDTESIEKETSHQPLDTLEPLYSFLGVWNLEYLAFSMDPANLQGLPYTHMIVPQITDFIGYEVEFHENFVRLGDRLLQSPKYIVNERASSIFNRFPNFITQTWIPAYFDEPSELIEYFHSLNIDIGRSCTVEDRLYLDIVRIEYPVVYMFNGGLLDPDLFDENVALNEIFQGFTVLSDNYILFGVNDFVVARRAN